MGDKHRREEFPKYGNRYHNNAKSSFLETGVSESIETKGIRVHTGEIIFLSKSEITSEMHRQSILRNVCTVMYRYYMIHGGMIIMLQQNNANILERSKREYD